MASLTRPAAAAPPAFSSPQPIDLRYIKCLEYIQTVAARVLKNIPVECSEELKDPVTLELLNDPMVLGCLHRVGRAVYDQLIPKTCPCCKTPIITANKDFILNNLIEELQKQDRIPSFSHFQEENKELAQMCLEAAQKFIKFGKYDDALKEYAQAFQYTKASEDYAAVPSLYKTLKQNDQEVLSFLYLAIYQLEEGQVEQAMKTLQHAQELDPTLKIESLLVHLDFLSSPQPNIDRAMALTATLEDHQEKIAIYSRVLEHDPDHFEAYLLLAPLLNFAERRDLLLKAASRAEEIGATSFVEKFHAQLKIPAYPTEMTLEDWKNLEEFLKKLPPYPEELVDFLAAHPEREHIVFPLIKKFTRIVDGEPVTKPLNLEALGRVDQELGGRGYSYLWNEITRAGMGEPQTVEFEWAVMTRDVLEGTRNLSYVDQERKATELGYEVPDVLTAAYGIFFAYRLLGARLYSKNPWTYTRCREALEGYHLVVGGFAPDGLRVSYYDGYDSERVGVAGLRKF